MEAKFYINIGNVLRERRRAQNLSQEYMAYSLNISQNAYSKIESGRSRCTIYRFLTILNLLDSTPMDIFLKEEFNNWIGVKIDNQRKLHKTSNGNTALEI